MTPAEFNKTVFPKVLAAWQVGCFCGSPGFRKLLCLQFQDYGICPVGLADAEILISAIIQQRFRLQGESRSGDGEALQDFQCPQCSASCRVRSSEFSISMSQTTVTFAEAAPSVATGLYLVGFYGFQQRDFERIGDFRPAADPDAYLEQLQA